MQLDDIDIQYMPPQDHQFKINFEELSATAVVKESNKGFMVRGGPWEKKAKHGQNNNNNNSDSNNSNRNNNGNYNLSGQPLDTSNAQEFPAFGGGPGSDNVNGNSGELDDTTSSTIVNGDRGSTIFGGSSAWGRRN